MNSRALYSYRDFLMRCGIGLGVTAAVCAVMGLLFGLLYLGWLHLSRLVAPLGVNPVWFWVGMVAALAFVAGVLVALAGVIGRAALPGRTGR